MSCSTTGSLARPNSWMQRSMVATPSSRLSQSPKNSWILRRERRKRSDSAAMKVASDQTALAHLQVPPAPLDIRARSDAGAGDAPVAARAAHGEVDVLGRRDLKSHFAAGEFEAVVRADASALQVRPQGALAGGADDRRVRDFRAHDDRL